MTAFLSFTAKPGCEDQINTAYSATIGDHEAWLVYSQKIIEAEIAFIHSPEGAGSFSHVSASLHTVEDWNRIFPDDALGSGFLRVNPRGVDNSAEVKRVATFLITHRELFTKVEGIDAVCSELERASSTRGRTRSRKAA